MAIFADDMKQPCHILRSLAALALLLTATFQTAAAQAAADREGSGGRRPRVAVVLSGGGVKGAAHIGVLRAVEEAGIPIDYIVGTSMGSIVGGLYAMGYSVDQLDSLIRHQDWSFVLSDKSVRRSQALSEREWSERFVLSTAIGKPRRTRRTGFLRGQNLSNLLSRLTVGYHDSIPFDSLSIPFACVATNLANGEEVVMRSGIPATAMRASMAIPGAFTPVVLHDTTLVDGGLSNNFPVDVARRMGADVVIGSSVQKPFADTTRFNSLQDVLEQSISLACRKKYEDNVGDCDLCIRTILSEYSTLDFSASAIDTAITRGYANATAHRAALDSLRAVVLAAVGECTAAPRPPHPVFSEDSTAFAIGHVRFEDISPYEAAALRRACRLTDGGSIRLAQIEEALRLLRDKFLYVDAAYALNSHADHYDLTISGKEKSLSRVGLGARFDTEEMAALLLAADVVLPTRIPSHLSLTGKLGEQYSVSVGYAVEPALYRRLSLSYEFRYNDIYVNDRGHRAYNLSFHRHTFDLSYSHLRIRNFSGEVGVKVAVYDYGDLLTGGEETARLKTKAYTTGYVAVKYNSQDKGYYPTRGSKFAARAGFTTDNPARLSRPHAVTDITASWETVAALTPRLSLLPRVCGRAVWGTDIPVVLLNAYGGTMSGRYVEQQFAFAGVSRLEAADNALAIAGFDLRYNIVGRHFVSALCDVAVEHDRLPRLHRGRYFYGFGAQYGFNTRFGPIEAALTYSDNTRRPQLSVSVGFDF